jgi:hypothetical protein
MPSAMTATEQSRDFLKLDMKFLLKVKRRLTVLDFTENKTGALDWPGWTHIGPRFFHLKIHLCAGIFPTHDESICGHLSHVKFFV